MTPRERRLLKVYGISLLQYDQLLTKQKGCCAICLKEASSFTKNLCVDHDHVSGEIRGLLCNYCNHRLVGRHRDADLLHRIATYISQGTGLIVPKKKKKRKASLRAERKKKRAKVRSRRSKV